MAVNVGQGKIAYQKTKVFDTAGAHTFIHPLPGTPLEVFVELVGGGGGGSDHASTPGVAGGNSVWDTGGSATTANGGGGAVNNSTPGVGQISGGSSTTYGSGGVASSAGVIMDGLYGNAGTITNGTTLPAQGGSGYVKRFNATINGDINITVGAAGTNEGTSVASPQAGACIVHYNVIESEQPVTVLPTPEVDEYGRVTWEDTAQAMQSISEDVLTTLNLDTEKLDTGNFLSVGTNEFTLQSGTYELDAFFVVASPPGAATLFYLRLYNVTDASLEDSKMYQYHDSGTGYDSNPFKTVVKISSPKTYRYEIVSSAPAKIGRSDQAGQVFNDDTTVLSKSRVLITRKAYS